jgi:hypothetical protein
MNAGMTHTQARTPNSRDRNLGDLQVIGNIMAENRSVGDPRLVREPKVEGPSRRPLLAGNAHRRRPLRPVAKVPFGAQCRHRKPQYPVWDCGLGGRSRKPVAKRKSLSEGDTEPCPVSGRLEREQSRF